MYESRLTFAERMNKTWFETWFDSPYYHQLYDKRNEPEACRFLEHLIKELRLVKGAKILDAPCGTGRHVRFLEASGYSVTGADLSVYSIEKAKEGAGVDSEFLVHDIRRPFRINYFDLILNLFTSIGYGERSEDKKIFTSFNRSLKSGGILVVDFLNIEWVRNNLVASELIKKDGVEFDIRRTLVNDRILKDIRVTEGGKQIHFTERVIAYTREELENLLLITGFRILSVFGNYSLSIFDPPTSPRILFIAEKNK